MEEERGMKGKQRGRGDSHTAQRRPGAAPRDVGPAFVPHAHTRTDDANAFMPDPEGGPAHIKDDLAESLAEEFLQAATRGNEADEETLDGVVPEEVGGPFIETSAAEEFGNDTDDTNPADGAREPLPRAVGGLAQLPDEEEPDDEV
jgi:hypothetical protein